MTRNALHIALMSSLLLGIPGVSLAASTEEDPPTESSNELAYPLLGSRSRIAPTQVNPHGDISLSCERCHTAEGWTPLRDPIDFDHSADTPFVLTGRHEQANCRSCHVDLRFDGPDLQPDECASCHLDVHQGQLGTGCQDCHTTQDFQLVKGEEIHARTTFPLTGSHLQVSCESCHTDDPAGAFSPLDAACINCHEGDYEATASATVDHVSAGFPLTCENCHNTLSFATGVAFDHVTASNGFELLGAHNMLSCASCHNPGDLTPIFSPTDQNDCFTCHEPDHEAAHPNFPTTCQDCHTNEAFLPATFDHLAVSGGFGLVGAHMSLPCSACHIEPGLEPIWMPADQNDCFTCHEDEHADEHPNFPTTCQDCHTVNSWEGANFNHDATGFSLLGAHTSLDCSSCHTGPDFEPIWIPQNQNDCFTCHEDEHEDEHPNFPTTCIDCHTTSTWEGATFNHDATGFSLVGAHTSLDCSSCHTGPDFEPIWIPQNQNDCFTCHEQDSQQAHQGFPETCLDCHNVNTWEGATFDHDPLFPIFSGRHEGEWASCQTCHNVPGNFNVFTCLTCHEHNQKEMDDEHDDVGGYVYESNACFSCHPDGED